MLSDGLGRRMPIVEVVARLGIISLNSGKNACSNEESIEQRVRPSSLWLVAFKSSDTPGMPTLNALFGPRLHPKLECLVPKQLLFGGENERFAAILALQIYVDVCEIGVVVAPGLECWSTCYRAVCSNAVGAGPLQ